MTKKTADKCVVRKHFPHLLISDTLLSIITFATSDQWTVRKDFIYILTKLPHIIKSVEIAGYKSVSLVEQDWTKVIINFNTQPESQQERTSTVITSAFLWVIC